MWDTICHCTFPKSNQTISVHAEYMCCLRLLSLFFFVFVILGFFWFLQVPATVYRENSANFKRHWLMQHASRLTAAPFPYPHMRFVLLVCLFCVGLLALVLACLRRIIFVFQSRRGKVKKKRKKKWRQAFCSFRSTFLPLSAPLFPAHAYSV